MMDMRSYNEIVKELVCTPSRVAVVGASPKPERPVGGVMRYLSGKGFRLVPVNPAYAGKPVEGMICIESVQDVEGEVDIVAFFLGPEKQAGMLGQVRDLGYRPVIWFQPGAENPEAAAEFKAEGYEVVSGKCLMALHRARC